MTRMIRTLLVTTALCGLLAVTPARAASETTASSNTTVMSIRLTKHDVTDIQTKLFEKGVYKSKVDGQFGAGTQDALREYQSSEGIEANGYPTAATLEHLGVKPENDPVMGNAEPPGKGGVVYTETVEQKDVSATHAKPGSFANVDSPSPNGGSCLHCTNGPIGNGGTQSMHSNEY